MICPDCPPDPVTHPVITFPKGATVFSRPDFRYRGRFYIFPGEHLVVLERRGKFARVRVSNGRGPTYKRWVYEKEGRLVRRSYSLVVRRDKRDILLFRDGERISRFKATVGASSTPTPVGIYAIRRRIRLRRASREYGTYGCCVLTLDRTVFAPFGDQTWGSISLHRSFGGDLGRAVSHGCIRVSPARLRWLYEHLSAGTLVRVV